MKKQNLAILFTAFFSILISYKLDCAEQEITTEEIRKEYQDYNKRQPRFIDNLFYGYTRLYQESCPKIYKEVKKISEEIGLKDVPNIYVFCGNVMNSANKSIFGSDRTNKVSSSSVLQYFSSLSIGEKLILNIDWKEVKKLISLELLNIKKYNDLIKWTLLLTTSTSSTYLLKQKINNYLYLTLAVLSTTLWLKTVIENSQDRYASIQINKDKKLAEAIKTQTDVAEKEYLLKRIYENDYFKKVISFYNFLTCKAQ